MQILQTKANKVPETKTFELVTKFCTIYCDTMIILYTTEKRFIINAFQKKLCFNYFQTMDPTKDTSSKGHNIFSIGHTLNSNFAVKESENEI